MKLLIADEEYRGPLRNFTRQFKGDLVAAKLDGFQRRRRHLRSACGLDVERVRTTLDDLPELIRHTDAGAVLFAPSWRHAPEAFQATLARLPERPARPALVVFDTFDQTSSPYFGSLHGVDLYLKSQLLRDRTRYRVDLAGGNNLADWVHRELGFDLGAWHFGSTVPEGYGSRLACGWNMGVSRAYGLLDAATRLVGARWHERPIELHRRFTIPDPARPGPWEWYQEYRRFCGLRTSELCGAFRQTGHDPIPRAAYLRELRQSRIVFSPFGWGEVCIRDFEAIACGAVLVKPDMGHLETYPDIYEDGVTYVAVRWDLADLPDACRRILDDPALAERIAAAARRRLLGYVAGGAFDARLRDLLDRLAPVDRGATRAG